MPYRTINGTAANTADLMATLQAHLVTTVGWTLHDQESDGSDHSAVFTSPGENGRESICLFIQRTSTTNRLYTRAYQSWDNETHQGFYAAYQTSYTYIRTSETPFLYWMYADLNHWFVVTKIGSTYYGHYAGIIQRNWSDDVAITQAPISTGDDQTLQVDEAGFLEEGHDYFLADHREFERVTVTSVNTSVAPHQVTLASVPRAFATGARLGEDPLPNIVSRYDAPGTFYACNHSGNYSSASSQTGSCESVDSAVLGWSNSDGRFGLTTLYPIFAGHSGSGTAENRGQLINIFKIGPNNVDSEDTIRQGDATYRVFNLQGAGFCAVLE